MFIKNTQICFLHKYMSTVVHYQIASSMKMYLHCKTENIRLHHIGT